MASSNQAQTNLQNSDSSKMPLEANGIAIVTGAASGIGLAISKQLARNNYSVIMVDVNEESLNKETNELKKSNFNVISYRCDITQITELQTLVEHVTEHYARVDILVNNAGVAIAGSFIQMTQKDFDWLMQVNFFGMVNLTRLCLPLMLKQPKANIVNIASIFGVVAPPGQTAYSASKFAVKGFSKSLSNELSDTNIAVSVVYPGGVNTNIAKDAKRADMLDNQLHQDGIVEFQKHLVMPPEKAAAIIIDGMKSAKTDIYVGNDAKIMRFIERLFPKNCWKIAERLLPNTESLKFIRDSYHQ